MVPLVRSKLEVKAQVVLVVRVARTTRLVLVDQELMVERLAAPELVEQVAKETQAVTGAHHILCATQVTPS
jgi:hypothetical protein